jgi:hypothetical protein
LFQGKPDDVAEIHPLQMGVVELRLFQMSAVEVRPAYIRSA